MSILVAQVATPPAWSYDRGMSEEFPAKVSAARRKGDAYEEALLGRECLRMLDDPSILSVRHEPAEFEPAGDVVVEGRDEITAF